MKCAGASQLDRKSGVRLGERGAPVQFPLTLVTTEEDGLLRTQDFYRVYGGGAGCWNSRGNDCRSQYDCCGGDQG